MKTVIAIHAPDAEHLVEVKAQMEKLGAPEIKVVDCGDYYMALEGSHRLAAASQLEIEPVFTVFEQDDILNTSDFDWAGRIASLEECETYAAGEIAGELYSMGSVLYRF